MSEERVVSREASVNGKATAGPGALAAFSGAVRSAEVPLAHADPIGAIVERLGGDLAQVFLFMDARADFANLVASAQGRFGDVPVVACTTAGEINSQGYSEDGIVAIGLPKENFATRILLVENLRTMDGTGVVGDVIRTRMTLDSEAQGFSSCFGFLVVDGLSLREDQFMSAIAPGIGPIPVFGGSAGDGERFDRTLVSLRGRTYQNAAVLTLVKTRFRIEVFSVNHLIPGDERMVVTRADPSRRIVCEINGEPAAREYARLLGKDPENLSPFTFAAHPLVVRVGGQHHVRAIQRVTEEGELVFYSAIDDGIVLTLAEPEDMVIHLERAMARLAERGEIDTILTCDCCLRRIEAGQKQQTRAVSQILKRYNVLGFNTYGEQVGTKHVNHTMTGVVIYKPEHGTADVAQKPD